MLTRKQQWRRMKKIRRHHHARSIIDLDPATSRKRRPHDQQHKHAACFGGVVEGEEVTGTCSSSSSSSSSFSCAWSSFDSLLDAGNSDDSANDGDSCGATSTAPLAVAPKAAGSPNIVDPSSTATVADGSGAARPKGVSFQQEVQVFLVTHKSELDHSAKRALWWTGRDAAINKRAWLNHLGQPGCGRQSAIRPRKEPQQQQDGRASSNFLGAGRNTAAGRGRGIWSAHHNSGDGFGSGVGGAVVTGVGGGAAEALDAAELHLSSSFASSLPVSVGILGCRCEACLTEGDENEPPHHQHQLLPSSSPPYSDQSPSPSPSPPARSRHAGRPASKTWPSPADWGREDDDDDGMGFSSLGWCSRSYSSPASSRQGSSPLREACESYDDDDDVFPRGSNFFHDDDSDDENE